MSKPGTARTDADRCPGVSNPHIADDGALTRIRVPGGMLEAAQMAVLARVAEEYGDGHLELTSRANVQIRGVHNTEAVMASLAAGGLVPSVPHQTVRNIAMSPLTGRIGGRADVRDLVVDLDRQICADPRLTKLPGRFLFGVDDGRGDVLDQRPDVGVLVEGDTAQLVVGGRCVDRSVPRSQATGALLELAHRFSVVRQQHWRVAELSAADRDYVLPGAEVATLRTAPTPELIGWLPHDDGSLLSLGATVAHGRLSGRQAEFLAAIGAPMVITAHRSVVICDLTEAVADTVVRVLAPMGLIFDAASPWTRISGCVGAPACAKSRGDVRAQVETAVRTATLPNRSTSSTRGDRREHWVGCDRGCGSPHRPHTLHVATEHGWESHHV